MSELWSREEFTFCLQAVGDQRYHDKHPFHMRMHRGELRDDELRGWILNRFYYQKKIPVKDALILSKLPTREDRRQWLQRIIDHDGRQGDEGGIEAWLRLGEAAGLTHEQMLDDGNILPGARFAVDAYVNFCRLMSWREAVASSLTELFAPGLVGRRIGVIEQLYPWVKREGLDYFRRRLEQAPRDAEHALDLVVRSARTREDQERAVAALGFKCDVLWALLDAVEHAYTRQGVACPSR